MTAIARQNTLFVSEDWIKIYEAMENVDFRAYDFDNYVQAILTYVNVNYPEEFNDWLSSSEFVTKIEVLAWLSQNIAFRIDLNTRENFLATAERRISLIRLAQNVAYKVSRVRSASGQLKILKVRTTQSILDSNGTDLSNRNITWNDATNDDSFEQFILVMNAAFSPRTQFGRPLATYQGEEVRTDQYTFDAISPSRGTYPLSAGVNRVTLPFDVYNANLNIENGVKEEIPPNPENFFTTFYQSDGNGISSINTGFFLPLVQGNLQFADFTFEEAVVIRVVDLGVPNTNRDDFFIQRVDEIGNVLEDWIQVDTIFGEGVSFNTLSTEQNKIYEIDTMSDDKVRIRFGDGKYGEIPVGNFRVWYRTANPQPLTVPVNAIQNNTVTIPYAVNGILEYLTLSTSLINPLINAAATETNFDIRTRANQVFHTQNRMVTGRDYNNFYLKDNAIKKVKSVNRTFAGHSRYSKLTDPTGLYQNIKIVAEDGRYYQDDVVVIDLYTANTDILPIDEFIHNNMQDILSQHDKQSLYYNNYEALPLVSVTESYTWQETNIVSNQSRGNIIGSVSGSPVAVGDTGLGNFKYIDADAFLLYGSLKGSYVSVERLSGDGTVQDGIILDSIIPDGTELFTVLPPMRKKLIGNEISNVTREMEYRLDFGISWNLETATWDIITFENIDKSGIFSLEYQGDDSKLGKDASWMIMMEFIAGGNNGDQWRLTDRGISTFFESAREVDFYFNNTEPVLDPETGDINYDQIKLLACNESRDSLRRRRLGDVSEKSCAPLIYTFKGDGETTCFKTSEHPLTNNVIIMIDNVLQILGTHYEIKGDVTGDSVCFFEAPVDGAVITISVSDSVVVAKPLVVQEIADGVSLKYPLGTNLPVNGDNTFVFMDGVYQPIGKEYSIDVDHNDNAFALFTTIPPLDVKITMYSFVGVDSNIFQRYSTIADGIRDTYNIPVTGQSIDTLFITIDGVTQDFTNYTVSNGVVEGTTDIIFNVIPPADTVISIAAVAKPINTITKTYSYVGNGATSSYELVGLQNVSEASVMVALDGVNQDGTWSAFSSWSITQGNIIRFNTPVPDTLQVTIFVTAMVIGQLCCRDDIGDGDNGDDGDNLGDISTSSCLVNYLGEEVPIAVSGEIRHDDGYVNTNGIIVSPPDEDSSGVVDNPLLFRDIVLQDGFTDLVFWRRIEESGFSIWDPVNRQTSPQANYGFSDNGYPSEGSTVDTTMYGDGDIHFDLTTGNYLLANIVSGIWDLAPDQGLYRQAIGRDHLKFMWVHYAPDAHRIDPSVSNVMDVYILTQSYDSSIRTWLQNNGELSEVPVPPTSEGLRIQFEDFENYKTKSDSMIYHPSRYKILFGRQAVSELRATFKVIKTQGVTISDENLRTNVLNAIDVYFEADRWDFGETFYFTELAAYIHSSLAPNVHSVVIVPVNNDQAFGRLFQVRSEPDELFISSASAEDVEIVQSFTDEELKISEL